MIYGLTPSIPGLPFNSIDPYGYATKSLAMNEFLAPRYGDRPIPGGMTLGEIFLEAFGLPTDPIWCWGGVVFCAGYAIILVGVSVVTFVHIRFDRNIGSARAVDADETGTSDEGVPKVMGASLAVSAPLDEAALGLRRGGSVVGNELAPLFSKAPLQGDRRGYAPGGLEASTPLLATLVQVAGGESRVSAARMLPFEPASVAFRNVAYTVRLSRLARIASSGSSTRQLLQGINGFAEPGRMLALMGASGAG